MERIEVKPPPESGPGISQATSVMSIGSDSYFIDQEELNAQSMALQGAFATTIIHANASDLQSELIQDAISQFKLTDDVWKPAFLDFVVFVGESITLLKTLPKALSKYLESQGTTRFALIDSSNHRVESLAEGPYIASSKGFYPVRKLVPDTQAAFVASLVQIGPQRIKYLNASLLEASPNCAVAVPSRLPRVQNASKPLDRLRFAVKDNIHVQGAKTFASSLAYGEYFGVSETTAPSIQRLIDLGAILVGKTGMSQFADAEEPTDDFVEFHCPRNPRGDGLRSPGGSSFGAGAATGAYNWIHFTVGTDSSFPLRNEYPTSVPKLTLLAGGSVRVPAAHQSVFGFRPSRGTLSLEGTLILDRDLDSVGFLSSDLRIIDTVMRGLEGPHASLNGSGVANASVKLIYPTHLFPVQDESAQSFYDKVVLALETVTGAQRQYVNFVHEWQRQNPSKADFHTYFKSVFYDLITWGQYQERKAFREGYEARFGRPPYINPMQQYRLKVGETMTADSLREAQYKREEYQRFVESIFGEVGMMLTPFMYGEPEQRDIYKVPPAERDEIDLGLSLRPAFQSPLAGQPELVFPVGQMAVMSNVSRREEMYGVIASIIGSKGLDRFVIGLACKVMDAMNIPKKVMTGRVPFAVSGRVAQ